MPSQRIRKIAIAGTVGALYAALTITLNIISYGPIQFRIAETLCILPYYAPYTAWGLFAGCIIANIMSPYPLDMIIGPIATLLAALCTMQIGKAKRKNTAQKIIACAPPVIINAIMIGALIAYYTTGADEAEKFLPMFIINSLQVGLGEAAVMYAIGLPLMLYLPKTRIPEKLEG